MQAAYPKCEHGGSLEAQGYGLYLLASARVPYDRSRSERSAVCADSVRYQIKYKESVMGLLEHALLRVLRLSDGAHDLLSIAQRSGLGG
jgi:hypothetical protein